MSELKLDGISTIVLDIEGTVCPIWFVARVLYPYAIANLEKVVTSQWDEDEFALYKAAFPVDLQTSPEAIINHCYQLASKDIKDPAWKKLQGLIWRQGYANGTLSVPLFQDVAPKLKLWYKSKYTLAIFSSGSVEAQKLFFKYVDPNADPSSGPPKAIDIEAAEKAENSEKRKVDASTLEIGADSPKKTKTEPRSDVADTTESNKVKTENLNFLFEDNFDTINAGPKNKALSYEKIARAMEKKVDECLFLSDNVHEIVAAKEAGFKAIIVDRPGNAALSKEDREKHQVITTLDQIDLGEA